MQPDNSSYAPQFNQPVKKQKHTARRTLIGLVILIVLGAAAYAGYRIISKQDTAADVTSANATAATAAREMTAQAVDAGTPIKDIAKLAVGDKSGARVEALEADGTAADGTVTLRITADGKAAECYAYRLQQGSPIQYNRLNNCTSDPALQL